jgi:transposase
MAELWLLNGAQMRRIAPDFPLSQGIPRVDDRRIVSGIIFVVRNGLRGRDAPPARPGRSAAASRGGGQGAAPAELVPDLTC